MIRPYKLTVVCKNPRLFPLIPGGHSFDGWMFSHFAKQVTNSNFFCAELRSPRATLSIDDFLCKTCQAKSLDSALTLPVDPGPADLSFAAFDEMPGHAKTHLVAFRKKGSDLSEKCLIFSTSFSPSLRHVLCHGHPHLFARFRQTKRMR